MNTDAVTLHEWQEFSRRTGVDRAIFIGDVDKLVSVFTAHGLTHTINQLWGVEALHTASSFGHVDIVRVLLGWGVFIGPENGDRTDQMTALAAACHSSRFRGAPDFPAVVELLLSHGANLRNRNLIGRTLLHRAAMSCDSSSVDVASILIAHGIDVNVLDDHGVTPLSMATTTYRHIDVEQRDNQIRMVEFLLLNGANPSLKSDKRTPLDMARLSNHNPRLIHLLKVVAETIHERDAVVRESLSVHPILCYVDDEIINDILRRVPTVDMMRRVIEGVNTELNPV